MRHFHMSTGKLDINIPEMVKCICKLVKFVCVFWSFSCMQERGTYLPVLVSLHGFQSNIISSLKHYCLFIKGGLHSCFSIYFWSLFISSYSTSRHLRSTNSLQLIVPRTHLKLKVDRAFSVTAPQLWKNLPLYIKSASTWWI